MLASLSRSTSSRCSHRSIRLGRNQSPPQYHDSIDLRQRRRRPRCFSSSSSISSSVAVCSSSSSSSSLSLSSSSRIERTTSNSHGHSPTIPAAPSYYLSSSLISSPPVSLSTIRFFSSDSNKEETPTTTATTIIKTTTNENDTLKNTKTTDDTVIHTTPTKNTVDATPTVAATSTNDTNQDTQEETTGVRSGGNGGGGGGSSFQDEFDYPFPLLPERGVYDIASSAFHGLFQLVLSQGAKNQFEEAMNKEPRIIHPTLSKAASNGLLLSIALYYDIYHNPLWQKTIVERHTKKKKKHTHTNAHATAPIVNNTEENEKKIEKEDNETTIKSENRDTLSSSSSSTAEEERKKNDEEATIESSATATEEEEEEEEEITERVVHLFEPQEFLNGVLPALTSFHNVQGLLLNEMIDSDHYSQLSLQERTASMQQLLHPTTDATTAEIQDAPRPAEREKKERAGEQEEGTKKNEWMVEAEKDDTSLAGTLMKMVTHDVYHNTHKNTKMDTLKLVHTYVQDTTTIQNVALLSARCFEIPIPQNLAHDPKEEKHNDNDDITSPIIAAQIDVLYDVKQTYLKRYYDMNDIVEIDGEKKDEEHENRDTTMENNNVAAEEEEKSPHKIKEATSNNTSSASSAEEKTDNVEEHLEKAETSMNRTMKEQEEIINEVAHSNNTIIEGATEEDTIAEKSKTVPETYTTESKEETQLIVGTFIGYLDGSPIDDGQLRWKIAKMRVPYEEFPDLYDY